MSFCLSNVKPNQSSHKENSDKRKYELEPMKKLGNWVKHEKMKVAKMQQDLVLQLIAWKDGASLSDKELWPLPLFLLTD